MQGDRVAHVKVTGVIMGLLARDRLFDLEEHWEDICQEVLVRLIKSVRAGTIRESAAFVGYCATVTRRESYRWLKKRREARERLQDTEPDETQAPTERSDDPELLVQMARALEELPEKRRRVMDAIYLRGCTYEEAAELLGMPLGTLKRAQTEALRELREKVGSKG